jgi:hypothetical protein
VPCRSAVSTTFYRQQINLVGVYVAVFSHPCVLDFLEVKRRSDSHKIGVHLPEFLIDRRETRFFVADSSPPTPILVPTSLYKCSVTKPGISTSSHDGMTIPKEWSSIDECYVSLASPTLSFLFPFANHLLALFQSYSQTHTSNNPVSNHLVGQSSDILLPQVCNCLSVIKKYC